MKTFDLKTVYSKDRPLSWSAISSFEWNPRQWYDKYVSGEKPIETPELIFGSMVDKKIQKNKKYLPKLIRYPILQHEMRCEFSGIPLLGFADTFREPFYSAKFLGVKKKKLQYSKELKYLKPAIRDYKTGRKPWDQKRADETGQITMYLLMLWLMDKIRPEDVECYIDWLPTHIEDGKIAFIKEGDIRTFKTKRTMAQVLAFGNRIRETYKAMEAYAEREESMVVDNVEDWG